jgi:hypothetical protein
MDKLDTPLDDVIAMETGGRGGGGGVVRGGRPPKGGGSAPGGKVRIPPPIAIANLQSRSKLRWSSPPPTFGSSQEGEPRARYHTQ